MSDKSISQILGPIAAVSLKDLMESDWTEFLVYIEHLRSAMKAADAVMEQRARKLELASWDQDKIVAAIKLIQIQMERLSARFDEVSRRRIGYTPPYPYPRPGPRPGGPR